jgi:hypothetical protein
MPQEACLLKAPEIARVGPVTAALLADTFDKLRQRNAPVDKLAAANDRL